MDKIGDKFVRPQVPKTIKVFPPEVLNGQITVTGDKVTAVHLLLATVILQEESRINNIHYCGDLLRLLDWIQSAYLAQVDQLQNCVVIKPSKHQSFVDLSDLADTRSNICLVSALAIRDGKVIFGGTKGCTFADRKADRHFALMEAFGLEISKNGRLCEIICSAPNKSITFNCSTDDYGPSVGVTCHALIASLAYPGKITLVNVALESAPMTLVRYIENFTNRIVKINKRKIVINEVVSVKHRSNELELPPDVTEAYTYIAALVAYWKGRDRIGKYIFRKNPCFSIKCL